MKEVKSSNGETELQTQEYAPAGPARIRSTSYVATYQDVYKALEELRESVDTLKAQIASLQMSAPRGIPKP